MRYTGRDNWAIVLPLLFFPITTVFFNIEIFEFMLSFLGFGLVSLIIAIKKNSVTIKESKLVYDAYLFRWHVVHAEIEASDIRSIKFNLNGWNGKKANVKGKYSTFHYEFKDYKPLDFYDELEQFAIRNNIQYEITKDNNIEKSGDTTLKSVKGKIIVFSSLIVISILIMTWLFPFSPLSVYENFSYTTNSDSVRFHTSKLNELNTKLFDESSPDDVTTLVLQNLSGIYEQDWLVENESFKMNKDVLAKMVFDIQQVRNQLLNLTTQEEYIWAQRKLLTDYY